MSDYHYLLYPKFRAGACSHTGGKMYDFLIKYECRRLYLAAIQQVEQYP
jgi:hypothetical protein